MYDADPDIWQADRWIVAEFGDQAWLVARSMRRETFLEGDFCAAARWTVIMNSVALTMESGGGTTR